jgi:hypothetical protein
MKELVKVANELNINLEGFKLDGIDGTAKICAILATKLKTLDALYDIMDEMGLEGSWIEIDIESRIEDKEITKRLIDKTFSATEVKLLEAL